MPAAMFQSINIGGGYGTGRELIEYFTRFGPQGGILGFCLTAAVMGLVLGLSFEFARISRVYDYRKFFQKLIGSYWIWFEVIFLTIAMITLAVVAAAAENILKDLFDIPTYLVLLFMILVVGVLSFYGREAVKNALTSWSAVLYLVLAIYVVIVFIRYGAVIREEVIHGGVLPGWEMGALKYAWYCSATVPAILFAARDIATTREAVIAGFGSSLFFIFPAFMFHFSFMTDYPHIVTEALPVYSIMGMLNLPLLLGAYTIVLFGTLIETCIGIVQAVNERIDGALLDKGYATASRRARLIVGVGVLILCAMLSRFGIITLVAKGYGLMAWGFLVVYIIPLFTIGVVKMRRNE